MKILIIGSVFYPRTSPRALRSTELAKYFADQGHDVTVYACIGNYDYKEFTDKYNVVVKNIPKRKFAKLESDGSGVTTFIDKCLSRAFGHLLEFPNIELAFKMKSVLKNEHNVDLLISIAIPHTIHWGIAYCKGHFKGGFPKFWISDCGDPYMGNSVGKSHPFYFKYIERYWSKMTDRITIPIDAARLAYMQEAQEKISVIPQGFDFSSIELQKYKQGNIPTFAFAGATYPGYRDPTQFLDYLSNLDFDFKFYVFTPAGSVFYKYQNILGKKLILSPYIPRLELLHFLSGIDFLINIKNSNIVQSPSKLIDYAATKRPILSISSQFSETQQFNSFIHRDYSSAEIIDIQDYDIRRIGQAFLNLAR